MPCWRRSFGFSPRDVSYFRAETPLEVIHDELGSPELLNDHWLCVCNPCRCADELAAPVPPIAEFPSFADRRTWIVATVVMLATIGGSWLVDVLRAAQ